MLRTQISLTEEERQALADESARTGKSVSALIRAAVDEKYGVRSTADAVAAIEWAAGSWRDHGESGEQYVERLRTGRRLSDLDRPGELVQAETTPGTDAADVPRD